MSALLLFLSVLTVNVTKKIPCFFEKQGMFSRKVGDFLGKAHHFCAQVAPLGATAEHGGSSLPALRLADGEG